MSSRARRLRTILCGVALAIGAAAFAVGLAFFSPLRVWEAFLVNLLFWTGMAQGAIVFSASLYMCQARWGGAGLYRIAEVAYGFLPIGFVLFWAIFAGRYWIFPWLVHPIPYKAIYLNVPFLFARDGGGLLFMWLLSWLFVRASRQPHVIAWAEDYESLEDAPGLVAYLTAPLAIFYTLIYSMLGVDLIMSLSPQWYSTMFPVYFAFGAFVSGIMLVGLLIAVGVRPARHDSSGERGGVLHDIGKLVFAGPTFWVFLLFAMYLVIWYGDIPKETFFVAPRVNYAPWGKLGWAAFCLVWVVPFLVLLTRAAKENPVILGFASFAGLVGYWLERYVLVAPSLTPRHVPFGWIEGLITLGFVGLFGLSLLPGLRRVPTATLAQARKAA